MTFNKEQWISAIKKSVADTKMQPSAGLPCAIATLRLIRDAMLAEVSENDKPIVLDFFNGEDGFIQAVIKADANEGLVGFASNASAAAKAAKLESKAVETLLGLQD